MTVKRKFADTQRSERSKKSRPSWDSTKLAGDDHSSGYEIRSRIDPTTGQRGAFPVEEDDGADEDGLFYGPAEDGMAYLKMVRSEARGVPSVLLAPTLVANNDPGSYQPDEEDWPDGFSEDEAFVGFPDDTQQLLDEDEESDADLDPQDAYYKSLLQRYSGLRDQLAILPPSSSAEPSTSGADNLMRSATASSAKEARWTQALLASCPNPRYLASLSQGDIIRGLDRLGLVLIQRHLIQDSAIANLGAWTWTLLARCREVSQMSSEEVSVLRVLSKKALRLGGVLRRAVMLPEEPELDDVEEFTGDENVENGETATTEDGDIPEGNTVGEDEPSDTKEDTPKGFDDETEAARARLLQLVNSGETPDSRTNHENFEADTVETRQQAIALLDIVVTIVGERYGQRDLLEQRAAW